ncbi:MAG: hypothetical protein Unbinned1473contig1001_8 [Prokaryotic dsDNA virus sp.]|nr:MAG: hypothetical protein Unbinned1473contig1001_8 [Prokaryotic dsDNA virus sp.]|tara:strand:- start:1469 stop:2482 length:1014 start_codon:yes stop_codon:yes gene_type:complete
MAVNNPILQAMMLEQLGIDTGALNNPGMGLGALSMTGNRRGSPAFSRTPTRNEMLIRAGGAMVGASPKGLPAALEAGAKTYGSILDDTRDRQATGNMLGLQTLGLKKRQKGENYIDGTGAMYREIFDPLGQSTFQNMTTGETVAQLPPGSTRVSDAEIDYAKKEDIKEFNKFSDDIAKVPEKLAMLQRYLDVGYDAAGVSVYKQLSRQLSRSFNIPLEDVDALTEIDNIRSRMVLELARELLAGQGQITEGERAIAASAAQDPYAQTPETFKKLVNIAYEREQRKLKLFQFHRNQLQDNPNKMFRESRTDFNLNLAESMAKTLEEPLTIDLDNKDNN